MDSSPYLGRTITYNNINWSALYHNLEKARRRWGMVLRVLEKTGEAVIDREIMYKAVVQTMMLYGRESWVIVYKIMKVLEGFYH